MFENNQNENEKTIMKEQRLYSFLNFIKKIRKIDLIIIVAILALLVFVGFSQIGNKKAGKIPVQAEKKVAIQVFFRNLIVTENPFKQDEKTFITIRNVPYTSLKILEVNFQPKKVAIPSTKYKKGYKIITDPAFPWQFDFVVTLEDTVKITNDGEYVVGGNKLKVGLPIILEGADYRFGGVINSIKPIDEQDEMQLFEENTTEENANNDDKDDKKSDKKANKDKEEK